MQRNQLAAGGFAALLFLGGVATGALGHRFFAPVPVIAAPDAARRRYVREMQDRLKLTPAQVTQLETIMHETKVKTKTVRDSIHPQILEIKHEHIARIRAILTPEQIPAYEKLVAEREQRSREMDEHDRNATH
jgi:Spy/CpxP family protein refolding chaperone